MHRTSSNPKTPDFRLPFLVLFLPMFYFLLNIHHCPGVRFTSFPGRLTHRMNKHFVPISYGSHHFTLTTFGHTQAITSISQPASFRTVPPGLKFKDCSQAPREGIFLGTINETFLEFSRPRMQVLSHFKSCWGHCFLNEFCTGAMKSLQLVKYAACELDLLRLLQKQSIPLPTCL